MRSLKALSFFFGFTIVAGCQGPDEFYRLSNEGDKTGTAGSSSPGTAGSSSPGSAGTSATGLGGSSSGRGGTTGAAGSIISGTAGSIAGTAGVTGAGGGGGGGGSTAGTAGTTGAAGTTTSRGGTTGSAGSSAGNSGTAGTTGQAGTSGRGGTTGAAGTTSRGGTTGAGGTSSSRGGTTGTAGASAGSAGTTGAGGTTGAAGAGAGGRGPDRIQVVAKCQPSNDAQNTRVTFKILNPESTAKAWSDIKVRYYFTPNMPLTPMVNFDFLQKFTANQLTTTATATYVEIGFTAAAGMLMGFDNSIGSDQIQMRAYNFSTPTWNTTWTDDYSYKSCTGVSNTDAYADRLTMPGYYQGQLAWGSEPDAP